MLEESPTCNFGWKAKEFTLMDPDGISYTMSEHLGEKGLLIAFICNHCPYVQSIAQRLAFDTAELMRNGINVLAVMSNDYRYVSIDSPPHMKKFAQQHNFTFPYLVDEDQSVGKAYGAVATPDFFGFCKDGSLQYRGRLDDAKMGNPAGRKRELFDAMIRIAETGQGPLQQTPSIGCSIKWS